MDIWICVCACMCALCVLNRFSCIRCCELLRLLPPWLSPGKNTGLGFHALLQEDLDPGIKTTFLKSPALADRFFTTRTAWQVPRTCRHTHTHTHTHICVCVYTYILLKTLLVYLERMPFNYIYILSLYFVVQSRSRVWLFATSWAAARQASLSFTISWSLLKLISIESVMPSNHLVLCLKKTIKRVKEEIWG